MNGDYVDVPRLEREIARASREGLRSRVIAPDPSWGRRIEARVARLGDDAAVLALVPRCVTCHEMMKPTDHGMQCWSCNLEASADGWSPS